jgi:peroxisomal leader peptide-processing protease
MHQFFLVAGIGPSVSTGFLSKTIRMPDPFCDDGSSIIKNSGKDLPVMLQTTAAVHPGASGGAVLDADGHMIGLVTR